METIAGLLLRSWVWIASVAWWRSEHFWRALVALVLPFGWVVLLVPARRIRATRELVRVRVTDFIRR